VEWQNEAWLSKVQTGVGHNTVEAGLRSWYPPHTLELPPTIEVPPTSDIFEYLFAASSIEQILFVVYGLIEGRGG